MLASLCVTWKYYLLKFEGRSYVTPTLCMEQGVQKPSAKGVVFKLAGLLKDPEASKASCFLLAFLACWPWRDQHHSLSQKVPCGLTTHAAPELSYLSFFPFSIWMWYQKGQHKLPRTPSNSSLSFPIGAVSQSNNYTSILSLCLRSHTKSAIITNIDVELRYGPWFLWNFCLSTCFFKS